MFLIAGLVHDSQLSGVLASAGSAAAILLPALVYPLLYLFDPLGWIRWYRCA